MSSSESSEVPDWVFKLSETDSDKAVQDEESSSQEHSQVFFTPEKEDVQSRKRESPSLDFGESPIKYVRSTFEIESRKKRLQDRQARKPKPQPSKPKLPRFPVNKPHTTSSKDQQISSLETDKRKLKTSNKNLLQNNAALKTRFVKKQLSLKSIQVRQKILAKSLSRKSLKILKSNKKETDLKKTITNLKKKVASVNHKYKKVENDSQELKKSLSDAIDMIGSEDSVLKRRNEELKMSVSYTESLLKDTESSIIKTRDGDKYTGNTRECIMELLSEGVGVHHVNNVMTSVSKLCGKTLSELPSTASINRIGDERASVAYMQIQDGLMEEENTTLQTDETRKHGDVYEVFAVRDKQQKEWILGLKDMKDKSSDSCLDTLKTVIEDIAVCTSTECGKQLLTNIRNTMSDRAATEKKFHRLLNEYREELLPSIYSNWEQLSSEEREALSTMNNFYCGLHILVNFAELSDNIIRDFEGHVKGSESLGAEAQPETNQFTQKSESGSVRLVRTTSKCLSRGGDDKSGCYLEFKRFLAIKYNEKSKKVSHLLVPFRGNRFNILFYNSEVVFYLAEDIKEFFEKFNKPGNRLQKAVSYDINVDLYLSVLKALGLCSKLVTAPFWRAMEDNQCTLEKATVVYKTLYEFLEHAKEDSSEVLSGDSPLPELVKKDDIYARLITSDEFDTKTIVVLQQIFGSWSTLLAKAASDHLTDGKFSEVSSSLAAETLSVPTHNKFPERVFALLDALTRYRPVASTLCNEAYIMFSLNKTAAWLTSLNEEEKSKLLNKARTEGRDLRKKYLQRVKAIEEAQKEALKAKRDLVESKEREKLKSKEQLVSDMLYYGLWQYPETVDQQLKGITSDAEKKKALKTQLQFRKIVLEQKADKKLFQLSEHGKAYTIDKLQENVKTLIRDSLCTPSQTRDNIFVGKRVVHYQMVESKRTPFNGRVISTVPGYPQWSNVVYEDDDAVYAYKLAEDYTSGDLEIIVEELIEAPAKKRRLEDTV